MSLKFYSLLVFFFIAFNIQGSSQIICIQCFDQTATISPSAPNLVLNGSFENSTCNYPNIYFCPVSTNYNCDIANWTCTGGGSSTYAWLYSTGTAMIPDGFRAPYFGNSFVQACPTLNDTLCLTQVGCEMMGVLPGYPLNDTAYGGSGGVSLEQTVSGLIPGNTYMLEFWAGGEAGSPADGIFGVDIGFGYNYLRDPETSITLANPGRRFLIEFKATNTSHLIKFTNWGHMMPASTELVLDDVRLYTKSDLNPSYQPCYKDTINMITIDTSICQGQNIVVNGKTYSNAGTYYDTVVHTPSWKDIYAIHLMVEQCIFINNKDTLICYGDSVMFNGSYVNAAGTYSDSTTVNPMHTNVNILHLNVEPCFDLFIPSAFSPNNDHLNDEFSIKSQNFNPSNYQMSIFNRWGELLFKTNDKLSGWNGIYKGINCELGVYFYMITFNMEGTTKRYLYKGDISLIR